VAGTPEKYDRKGEIWADLERSKISMMEDVGVSVKRGG
jgi:hypothetical protein